MQIGYLKQISSALHTENIDGGNFMAQDYLQGKKVLFVDEDCRIFYTDLFYMIADNAGPTSCLRTDPELSFHFRAIQERLKELIQNEKCVETISVGLADA